MQECQPLFDHLLEEKIEACCVAAWPGEGGDKTKLDRVVGDAEHDRDGQGRSFGRNRGSGVPGRRNHGHTTADQVSHQRRQAIILAVKPVVLDLYVLAFDVAGFTEPSAERGHTAR